MTDCGRCGDCCTRIPFHRRRPDIMRLLADPYVAGRMRADLEFIAAHWTPSEEPPTTDPGWWHGTPVYECDAFDPETRRCTAHADRPPICRDFPWYRQEPGSIYPPSPLGDLSPRCTYIADVRPFLPIVSVTRGADQPRL